MTTISDAKAWRIARILLWIGLGALIADTMLPGPSIITDLYHFISHAL